MEANDALRMVACEGCGTLNEAATEELNRLIADLNEADRQIGILRRQLAGQSKERAASAQADPNYQAALEVLEVWKSLIAPQAKELNGKRLENCLARLKHGYTPEDLKHCIEGYARFPIEVKGKLFKDVELFFRDAKHVDDGIERWELSRRGPQVVYWKDVQRENRKTIVGWLTRLYGDPLQDEGFFHWPCPRCELIQPEYDAASLTVASPGMTYIAQCSICNVRDDELLKMAVRESTTHAAT